MMESQILYGIRAGYKYYTFYSSKQDYSTRFENNLNSYERDFSICSLIAPRLYKK